MDCLKSTIDFPSYEKTICEWYTTDRRLQLIHKDSNLWAELFNRTGALLSRQTFNSDKHSIEQKIAWYKRTVIIIKTEGGVKFEVPYIYREWQGEDSDTESKLQLVRLKGNRLMWRVLSDKTWRSTTQIPFENISCKPPETFPPPETEAFSKLLRAYRENESTLTDYQEKFLISKITEDFTLHRTGLEQYTFNVTLIPNDYEYPGILLMEIQQIFYERVLLNIVLSPYEEVKLIITPSKELLWERVYTPPPLLQQLAKILTIFKASDVQLRELTEGITERFPFEDTRFEPKNRFPEHSPAVRKAFYVQDLLAAKTFLGYLATYMHDRENLSLENRAIIVKGLTTQFRFDRIATLKIERVFTITPLYFPSEIDPTYTVTPFNWTVTLICCSGTNIFSSSGNHAALIIEQVKNGKYKIKEAHLTNATTKPVKYRKWICREYSSRTELWQLPASTVQKMIDAIKRDEADPPSLSMMGKRSILNFMGSNSHSCFTWARKKLEILGIFLDHYPFETIIAPTGHWTEKREVHERSRKLEILFAGIEKKDTGIYVHGHKVSSSSTLHSFHLTDLLVDLEIRFDGAYLFNEKILQKTRTLGEHFGHTKDTV